jgi:hypothetical protein
MRRIVSPLLVLATAGLLGAAPAAAQTASTATPNGAGRPSKLHFDLDGSSVGGRLPSALQLTAPGFGVDFRAVSKRCREQTAKLNECSRGSQIGTGLLVIGVTTPESTREARIDVKVYLQSKTKILAVAYVFGWQVIPATLKTAGGLDVRLDPLPTGAAFPNVSYTLRQMTFDFGAKRVIKHRTVRRVAGKRRVTIRKRRVQLIHNPSTCSGSWPSSITATFKDGSVTPLAAPTPCAPK